jgi:hypothetical protein
MASNIREFEMGLKEFADSIPQQVGQLHRAVMLEGLKGVVLMSPVDTGRFRGAWSVSIDAPDYTEHNTPDKSGGPTIAKGSATIGEIRAYSQSFITNAVPYAEALENGHSQQAPKGMLNVTFQRLKSWLGRQK